MQINKKENVKFFYFWVGRYNKTLNDWPQGKQWVLFHLNLNILNIEGLRETRLTVSLAASHFKGLYTIRESFWESLLQKELKAVPLVGETKFNYQRKTVQNYELPDHNDTFLIDSIPRKANYSAFNK